MALNALINLGFLASFTRQIAGDEYAVHPLREAWELSLADGTSDNQGDFLYHAAGSVSSNGTTTIDMRGGGLTDVFGVALNPATVRVVAVRNTLAADASAANLTVGGTWGKVSGVIPRGGALVGMCGAGSQWATTAGTGDTITLAAGAVAVTYELILIGIRS